MPISKWDVPSILRRAAFAFFGIAGTELNSQFPQDVQALVPKGAWAVRGSLPRGWRAWLPGQERL
jgi:hypothetical protein